MNMILYVGLILLSAFVLVACNDDITNKDNQNTQNKPIVLDGEIDQVAVTRVNDSGFCDGDVMGVYIVDYEGNTPGKLTGAGNRANNVKFTFDEQAYRWSSAHDIYWKDNITHIDVYGYYPYGNPVNVEEYVFEVQKDQAREAANGMIGGYEASDFLWAKATDVAPTANIVRLSFKHKMSNVRVTLIEGTGFTSGEWTSLDKQILVLNTRQNSHINLNNGTIKAIGEVSATGIIPARQGGDFRAIIVPQTVSASLPLFSITIGSEPYKFVKEEAFVYTSGKMHNFSIVVNKRTATGDYEFVLASESITAWENDLVSHDATAREYVIIHVPEAGKLKERIIAANKDYRKLQNLKLTGQINAEDFYFMRDEMERLLSLNLKEVTIKAYKGYGNGNCKENQIPFQAMYKKNTLQHIVLPDRLEGIEYSAFQDCKGLTGSLLIPEGVIEIGGNAFGECSSMTGILSFPTTLRKIEHRAFSGCKFCCELLFPPKLTHIGIQAFHNCNNLYGSLNLPDGLEHIGEWAFGSCTSLSGSLSIPQGITKIPELAFYSSWGFNGILTLHDGITSIGESAFAETHFRCELVLPKNLTVIANSTFSACSDLSGELKLPDNLVIIGDWAFSNNINLKGTLNIPKTVQSVGSGAFWRCHNLEKVIFPAGLENIMSRAFVGCTSIGSIICKAPVPPYVQSDAFDGVPKDNCILEVPEQAIQQYQVAQGWSEFKRIVAHRELVCRPASATTLNTQSTRQLILDAEGDWEVESMPDWCSLSATNGTKKTELTLTIKAMSRGSSPRNGEIVFKLKGKDYTTRCTISQYDYKYDEDQTITLQQASKGKGVNLVFVGDGFNAEEISRGEYMRIMHEQVEHFFAIEPYTTYRDYFNVYTAIAVSQESGVETVNTIRNNRFGTTYAGDAGLRCNYDEVFEYALRMSTVTKANLNQSLVVVTPNTTNYEGISQLWEDGSAIAICPISTRGYPLDTRGVLQHEAGGHGFGKLGDESIRYNAFIEGNDGELRHYHSLGWYQNLSLTGKMHEVPWSHFIFHEQYSNVVDIYEGGYGYSRGVFRSEYNSCMNDNTPYYNAISRESIVKRIMNYAGEEYTFEKFLANDKFDAGSVTRSTGDNKRSNPYGYGFTPKVYKGKPEILK